MTPTKGELRRIALLDAAEHVLVTSGNANATMRNIAAASDVRIGHLQHYFPTRSDLMQAVLERVLQRSLAWMRETTGIDLDVGGDAPISRVQTALIFASMMQQQNEPTTVRLYVEIWAMAASDAEIATVLRDFYAHYSGYVEVIVHRAQPGLEASALQAKANSIVALFEGAAIVSAGFAGLRSEGTDIVLLDAIQHLIHGS
ncbi:TetR family transcriptional regulator [Arthrobacter psychrolactophilus]|uniref:TetR family transcriptional regulator n=1 Tax=Arthrobacter psychrolactophilus TaxID=92442 RepID=A0A2V5IWM7_9MICC|nr:TetR/AcrR family transcriptional regulator [Arthrobacter psychrolactophilus]PYI38653.1 TetR family transcriptional regulator [Arthrobacter psychrolactophilus]